MRVELSRFAKDALRRNEKEFRVAETEADMWLQIQKIDDELKTANTEALKQLLTLSFHHWTLQ